MIKIENLLYHIRHQLSVYGYAPEDIDYIGSSDKKEFCNWEYFKNIADTIYYEIGDQTSKYLENHLKIFFKDDSYLEYQLQYDMYQTWEHKKRKVDD